MNMQEIKSIARARGLKPGTLKKVELVQSMQQAEGNEACYCTGRAAVCGQDHCLWKDDCN